mgnify:CR=1 FL=1
MKITRPGFLWALILTFFLAGCGGSASAPPVDLPAPVAGFIDVSSPDAEGNVTVTGSEGSVPGGAIVMIVNESASASLITPFMGFFVSEAHASDDLPAICSEPGHSCTVADSEGRFVLVIAAAEGDTLTIGIIDSDGNWISELLTESVPEPEPEPEANCSEEGVAGEAVDLVVAPDGTPILLKRGSSTTTNQLVIGTGSSATEVAIEGCYARSLAMHVSGIGTVTLAVASTEDKAIWRGTYSSGEIKNTKSFTLEKNPMHAAFAGSANEVVVSLGASTGITLAKISLLSGGTVLSGKEFAGVARSLRVATRAMDGWMGLMLADGGPGTDFIIGLFDAESMASIKTIKKGDAAVKGIDALFDVGFWLYDGSIVRLASVGDYGSSSHAILNNLLDASVNPINISNKPSDLGNVEPAQFSSGSNSVSKMKRLAVNSSEGRLVTTGPDGAVYVFNLMDAYFGMTGDMVINETIASGHDFSALSLFETPLAAFVADATDGSAVDITSDIAP